MISPTLNLGLLSPSLRRLMAGPQSIRELVVDGGEDEWPFGEMMADVMTMGSAPAHVTPTMEKVTFKHVLLGGRPLEVLAER